MLHHLSSNTASALPWPEKLEARGGYAVAVPHGSHAKVVRSLVANEALVSPAWCTSSEERALATMTANTSSRAHPRRHYDPVSPAADDIDQSPRQGLASNPDKLWHTTITHVPSWPEEARTLKKHDWVSVLFALGDIVLVALPIYFICMYSAYLFRYPINKHSTWSSCHHLEWKGCGGQCFCYESYVRHSIGKSSSSLK